MVSEHDDNIDKILKMSLAKSIFINNEPIRDEYQDVEQPMELPKAQNIKRTFIDQSGFSYFNTMLDEDKALRQLKRDKRQGSDNENNKILRRQKL